MGELDASISKEQLEEEARQYGKVADIWIARNPAGFAFITFDDDRDAEDCVRGLMGKMLGNKEVRAEISALKFKYKFSNADLAVVGLYKLSPVVSSKLAKLNTL